MDIGWCTGVAGLTIGGRERERESIKHEVECPRRAHVLYVSAYILEILWEFGVKCSGWKQAETVGFGKVRFGRVWRGLSGEEGALLVGNNHPAQAAAVSSRGGTCQISPQL